MSTAIIQTLDTPDGAFTILEHEGLVEASGWTADHAALLARLAPAHRPDAIAEGDTEAAVAVTAYYAGDSAAIDAVPVRQHGTALQHAGWEALRGIAPGRPLTYAAFAARLGSPVRSASRPRSARAMRRRSSSPATACSDPTAPWEASPGARRQTRTPRSRDPTRSGANCLLITAASQV